MKFKIERICETTQYIEAETDVNGIFDGLIANSSCSHALHIFCAHLTVGYSQFLQKPQCGSQLLIDGRCAPVIEDGLNNVLFKGSRRNCGVGIGSIPARQLFGRK